MSGNWICMFTSNSHEENCILMKDEEKNFKIFFSKSRKYQKLIPKVLVLKTIKHTMRLFPLSLEKNVSS